jgi:MFS family permease
MPSRDELVLAGRPDEQAARAPSTATLDETGIGYGRLIATVALAGMLVPINSTMLAVALPDIRDDFGVGHLEIGWLVSAYLIGMVLAQPVGGRLGDQIGRKPVLLGGLAGFLAMSLAAAVAPSFWLLVAFRTGQALLGASIIPNGTALVREYAAPSYLGRANGLTGSVFSLSAAIGPLVGAALLAVGSWRLLFAVNVPLVAVAMLLVLALPAARRAASGRRVFVDWPGILLFAGLLTLITFLLGSLRSAPDPAALALAGAGAAVCLGLFVWRQFTGAQFTEWSLFKSRSYAAATSQIFFTNLVMYTSLLCMPFFLREVQGKGSGLIGILLGTMSLLMAAAAPIGGRLSDAHGRRMPAVAGSVLATAASLLLLLVLDEDVAAAYLALALAVLGVGIGFSSGAAMTAAIESAPRRLAGSAAGANSMMRYLGSILGAGILAGILNSDEAAPPVSTFQTILLIVSIMAALSIACAAMVHRFPRRQLD